LGQDICGSNEYDDGFAKLFMPINPSVRIFWQSSSMAHPVHDAGIRLAWDDEQILIWYIRQLRE
jgi:hypothetical protein